MILRVPHYFKDFKCIASECKDNCCIGGWEIEIDSETAGYYSTVNGEFGRRLKEAVCHDEGYYCFKLDNGRCPFLDKDNLCDIYRELGEDKMGVVCTQFPRFSEYFGAVKETGIGLACEEAARIILSDRGPFRIIASGIEEEETVDDEFDEELAKLLFLYRDKILKLMDSREAGFISKLIVLVDSSHKLQQFINQNDYVGLAKFVSDFDCSSADISEYRGCTDCDIENLADLDIKDGIARIIYPYLSLEQLNDVWEKSLNHTLDVLHSEDADYRALCLEFAECAKERFTEYENIVKYYIFRYLMKASYDHDLFGKMQMITANLLVIKDLDMTHWIDNNKSWDFQDGMDIIHFFSREVEYSEDNLWALSEEFMFDDIFSQASLIMLLIELKNLEAADSENMVDMVAEKTISLR